MQRVNLFVGLCVVCLFAPKTAHADIAYAGTSRLSGAGIPDGFTNFLYVNEGQPFDLTGAGGSEGVATEFNFWASRSNGVVTPFVAEAVRANSFIVRAIGTTRVGRTDWNSTGLQTFAFNDDDQPTIQDGWVAGFISSYPDGSGGLSPIPYVNSNVQGWLTGSQTRVGGPTITLDAPPTRGRNTDVNAHGLRRYQFQIGVEVEIPDLAFPGDFNRDGVLDISDLSALTTAIQQGNADMQFDLDRSGLVDLADRQLWVTGLKQTWLGDSNLDLQFDTGDLIEVFKAGQYEDEIVLNSTWGTGDWNGDGEFGTGDLIDAFKDAGFEAGPRSAVSAVPEPSSAMLLAIGIMGLYRSRRFR